MFSSLDHSGYTGNKREIRYISVLQFFHFLSLSGLLSYVALKQLALLGKYFGRSASVSQKKRLIYCICFPNVQTKNCVVP